MRLQGVWGATRAASVYSDKDARRPFITGPSWLASRATSRQWPCSCASVAIPLNMPAPGAALQASPSGTPLGAGPQLRRDRVLHCIPLGSCTGGSPVPTAQNRPIPGRGCRHLDPGDPCLVPTDYLGRPVPGIHLAHPSEVAAGVPRGYLVNPGPAPVGQPLPAALRMQCRRRELKSVPFRSTGPREFHWTEDEMLSAAREAAHISAVELARVANVSLCFFICPYSSLMSKLVHWRTLTITMIPRVI